MSCGRCLRAHHCRVRSRANLPAAAGLYRCQSIAGVFPLGLEYFVVNMGDADTGVTGGYSYGRQTVRVNRFYSGARSSRPAPSPAPTSRPSAAAVARAADSVAMTGTNFSSWYNQPEGTFVLEMNDVLPITQHYLNVNLRHFKIEFLYNSAGTLMNFMLPAQQAMLSVCKHKCSFQGRDSFKT